MNLMPSERGTIYITSILNIKKLNCEIKCTVRLQPHLVTGLEERKQNYYFQTILKVSFTQFLKRGFKPLAEQNTNSRFV